MFYAVQVLYNEDDSRFHFAVGIVWGETKKEAYEKAQNLFSAHDVYRFEINPIDLDAVKRIATKGGVIIARFEENFE